MDIGSIFIILAAVVVVTLLVARPFYDPRQRHLQVELTSDGDVLGGYVRSEDQLRSKLLAERDRVLTALKELEFDYSLGKIVEEDYPAQRAALLKSGAAILRQLDEMGAEEADSGDLVEATTTDVETTPGDDLEALIAARRQQKKESIRVKDSQRAAAFCHKCGKPLQKTDKFCSGCGATVG